MLYHNSVVSFIPENKSKEDVNFVLKIYQGKYIFSEWLNSFTKTYFVR